MGQTLQQRGFFLDANLASPVVLAKAFDAKIHGIYRSLTSAPRLDIGFFHGDPHPGNLLKITEGAPILSPDEDDYTNLIFFCISIAIGL